MRINTAHSYKIFRYFQGKTACEIFALIRGQWEIENCLHENIACTRRNFIDKTPKKNYFGQQ